MDGYVPRISDAQLTRALNTAGAVLIEGPRACGKTESARQLAASELRLDDEQSPRVALARESAATALDGATPRLLDEYQFVPALWNAVRRAVDERRAPGQFILTGSATPDDNPGRHPGAGRIRRVTMRTMTFAETGHSTGAVSLAGLFEGADIPHADAPLSLTEVVSRVVVGGWPGWLGAAEVEAREQAVSYLYDLTQHDFPTLAGPRRDPRRLDALLRALAVLSAQPTSLAAITRRMREMESLTAADATVATLLDFAVRMYLVEDQPAWMPSLRGSNTAHQTPVRHLADPSLAAALMGAGSERLLREPETLGHLFESQVVHDVRVYAQALSARGVYHFRDSKGRDEIDVVVEDAQGRWVAIEVKLGLGHVEDAAANLLRVTAKMVRPPTARVVVVPTGIAHRRADGVAVVPLTTLGA